MLDILQAIILGIVQGLTEFIPVSSSAHLIIIPWLLDWEDGALTSLTFDVALHLGTLFALLVTFLTARLLRRLPEPILDRWFFGLGTLNIQTAGMSGQTGVEETLVGLTNVQEVYEIVATQLRRFRGGMAPTAAEVEPEGPAELGETLSAILTEVRAIRSALRKGE